MDKSQPKTPVAAITATGALGAINTHPIPSNRMLISTWKASIKCTEFIVSAACFNETVIRRSL
ncbi:MAG: hypothetical protein ACXW0Q_12620 [Methylovulum sp.]